MGERRPVLRDVAEHAGVSLKTASRVINNDAGVAAGTRARVVKAVNALGYVPDEIARRFRAGTPLQVWAVQHEYPEPVVLSLHSSAERAEKARAGYWERRDELGAKTESEFTVTAYELDKLYGVTGDGH